MRFVCGGFRYLNSFDPIFENILQTQRERVTAKAAANVTEFSKGNAFL